MSMFVHKADVDGMTGMLRLKVQAEEKDDKGNVTRGPVEHIVLLPQALTNILGAGVKTEEEVRQALKTWMKPLHDAMLVRKHAIEQVSKVSAEVKGQTLEFD